MFNVRLLPSCAIGCRWYRKQSGTGRHELLYGSPNQDSIVVKQFVEKCFIGAIVRGLGEIVLIGIADYFVLQITTSEDCSKQRAFLYSNVVGIWQGVKDCENLRSHLAMRLTYRAHCRCEKVA
jgi:hypothetical protein